VDAPKVFYVHNIGSIIGKPTTVAVSALQRVQKRGGTLLTGRGAIAHESIGRDKFPTRRTVNSHVFAGSLNKA